MGHLYEAMMNLQACTFELSTLLTFFSCSFIPLCFWRVNQSSPHYWKRYTRLKLKKQTGRILYDRVIAVTFAEDQNIPSSITNMIWCVCIFYNKATGISSRRSINTISTVYTACISRLHVQVKFYSEPNWLKSHKPFYHVYKMRWERLYYFREKCPVCWLLSLVSVLGYQVQPIPQFLNYIWFKLYPFKL